MCFQCLSFLLRQKGRTRRVLHTTVPTYHRMLACGVSQCEMWLAPSPAVENLIFWLSNVLFFSSHCIDKTGHSPTTVDINFFLRSISKIDDYNMVSVRCASHVKYWMNVLFLLLLYYWTKKMIPKSIDNFAWRYFENPPTYNFNKLFCLKKWTFFKMQHAIQSNFLGIVNKDLGKCLVWQYQHHSTLFLECMLKPSSQLITFYLFISL